jgi:hypothetical protein
MMRVPFACGWYGAVLRFDGVSWTGMYVAETFPGRRIATLMDGMREAGPQVVVGDGCNAAGRTAVSGV